MQPTPAITTTLVAFAFAWGAVWGSFLNVVIWRLPRGLNLSRPGSACPHCGTPIRWRHNVPVVGWLVLRGRCFDCRAPISARYPAVELLVGLLSAGLWLHVTHGRPTDETLPQALTIFVLHFYLVAALVAIAFIDLDLTIIPHRLSMPLIAWGVLAGLLFPKGPVWADYFPAIDVVDSLVGAGLGFGLLLVVFGGYRLLRGIHGGGGGDLWLLAAIGANLGWMSIPFVLFAASFQGIAAAVVAMLLERRRSRDGAPNHGGLLIRGAHRDEYWETHPVVGTTATAAPAAPAAPADGIVPAAGDSAAPTGPDDTSFGRLAVPFGPFLALAAIEYVFIGRPALEWATSGILP